MSHIITVVHIEGTKDDNTGQALYLNGCLEYAGNFNDDFPGTYIEGYIDAVNAISFSYEVSHFKYSGGPNLFNIPGGVPKLLKTFQLLGKLIPLKK